MAQGELLQSEGGGRPEGCMEAGSHAGNAAGPVALLGGRGGRGRWAVPPGGPGCADMELYGALGSLWPLNLSTDKGKLGLNSGPWSCASADDQAACPAPCSKVKAPPALAPCVFEIHGLARVPVSSYILLGDSFQYAVHSNTIT